MISSIHHINFIVRNLDRAVNQYQKALGLGAFIFDSLDKRAVKTARIKLGQTWLVLVQPIDQTSEPARYLEKHGEGFFLLSLGTDDLDQQLKNYHNNSPASSLTARRRGLENWHIADLSINDFFGAQIQLTQLKKEKKEKKEVN